MNPPTVVENIPVKTEIRAFWKDSNLFLSIEHGLISYNMKGLNQI